MYNSVCLISYINVCILFFWIMDLSFYHIFERILPESFDHHPTNTVSFLRPIVAPYKLSFVRFSGFGREAVKTSCNDLNLW